MDPALAVARPTHRQVDGEEDGREARVERLGDQLVGDAVVAEDVDLEEADASGAAAATSAVLAVENVERQIADAGRRGGARHPLLPVRRAPAAGRRPARRRPASSTALAEHRRRRRDGVDPAEHPLAQPPRRERRDVLGERPLGAGAAGEVLGPVGVEARDGERLDVGQRQRRLHRVEPTADRRRGSPAPGGRHADPDGAGYAPEARLCSPHEGRCDDSPGTSRSDSIRTLVRMTDLPPRLQEPLRLRRLPARARRRSSAPPSRAATRSR